MRLGLVLGGLMWGMLIAVGVALTGCTFQVGIGYHGKTGIDDREASQLVRPVVVEDAEYNRGKFSR